MILPMVSLIRELRQRFILEQYAVKHKLANILKIMFVMFFALLVRVFNHPLIRHLSNCVNS